MSIKKETQDISTEFLNKLKQLTSARVAIGHSGGSLTTNELLKFQLEHAQARDAVHIPLDVELLKENIKNSLSNNWGYLTEDACALMSQAQTRFIYLQRPDLGRRLNQNSVESLAKIKGEYDLAICIVDGLSSLAVLKNTSQLLKSLFKELETDNLKLAPLTIVEQGRVAVGDHVAEILGAKSVLVLIGERPGLLSPDSLGAYLTYQPKIGCHDANRNCISNIRKGGLTYIEAAKKINYLFNESNRLGFSGVDLKERAVIDQIEIGNDRNFLV